MHLNNTVFGKVSFWLKQYVMCTHFSNNTKWQGLLGSQERERERERGEGKAMRRHPISLRKKHKAKVNKAKEKKRKKPI